MKDSLEKKLQVYAESDAYAFHMPGHKRVMDPLGGQAMKLDITEIDGFDNLHDAEGVLRDEMEAAAEMYGAQETLFSVNGSAVLCERVDVRAFGCYFGRGAEGRDDPD